MIKGCSLAAILALMVGSADVGENLTRVAR
jgi:hypothetical protein